MRLHTRLTEADLTKALNRAVEGGGVAAHLMLMKADQHRSQSRAKAFEVQLGTYLKEKGDGRRYPNSGSHGADTSYYAAKYNEWGFFFAEVFKLDPEAVVAGAYDGENDFHEKTKGAYSEAPAVA
jgi:hypothetical protein